jgi:short-subunit dehydrogenase
MPTALITGATAGIGAAFARRLAASGQHLVLVARDEQRLIESREALLAAGAPSVELLPADLTVPAELATVSARLGDRERPVDLLVNNAGIGLGKDFLDVTEQQIRTQLELNSTAVVLLCHAALPDMLRRGSGGIINVASIAGLLPGRGSTYAGSKALVISFSEGLSMMTRGKGVRVQALCPGFVRTEFHQRAGITMTRTPGWMYVDVDKLVARSLADLRADRPLSIPGGLYRGIAVLTRLVPRAAVRKLASRVNNKGRT